MKTSKPYILIASILLIIGTIYIINSKSAERPNTTESVAVNPRVSPQQSDAGKKKSKQYELAKEITTPDGFINTNDMPITISDLISKKVILIDFWTYSCINCQRTTPYLNAWYEKYKDKGFVIIGVHTPEFDFEKEYKNVLAATQKFGIQFPVVLDNDFSTWIAYNNRYWPRKYLIDIDGYIVYDHIGEGGYEETEREIQKALDERMTVLGKNETVSQPLTKEIPPQGVSGSPETYFGAKRNQFFGNGESGISGKQSSLTFPSKPKKNTLYLSGDWNITDEFAQNISTAGNLYTYTSKDVFFVSMSETETTIEVLRDGVPLGSEAGADIIKTSDGKTILKIQEARLYKIIQDKQSGTHTLQFKISRPELKAFTFTFG